MAVFLGAVYLWTAPGRITFPDDEIVFQTAESLWLRGDRAIAGIPKRTGEPRHLPSGTFGWATGRDGRRYGFFGSGLAVAALPLYGLADATAAAVPETWWHAVRSDHYFFHARGPRADWTRLVVSLTNTWVTALTAALVFAWLRVLGIGRGAAIAAALAYGLGTAAWPYARTFLSEPLSGLCLTASALMIAAFHRGRGAGAGAGAGAGWLWGAGLVAGLAAHVHVLNLSALPCLFGYAVGPLVAEGRAWAARRAWLGALALGGLALGGLAVDQALRFGSPLETGRFGHYSGWVSPWAGLAALLFAPGRSVLLYAPAATLGLAGAGALGRRLPAVAWFVLATAALRLVVIAARSDWYGGWGLGPRHLVPVLPLAVAPLALVWERWPQRGRAWRIGLVAGHAAAIGLMGLLASRSIFEWLFTLGASARLRESGLGLMAASHWQPWACPIVGFLGLAPDVLARGAWLLAQRGDPSLLAVFVGVAGIGLAALGVLARELAAGRARPRGE